MCKRTDKPSCQHHKMPSEPVAVPQPPTQDLCPQHRRGNGPRIHKPVTLRKSQAQRKEQIPPATSAQGSKTGVSRSSPVQEQLPRASRNTPKQAARNNTTTGPSPRGSKRPCQSPNAGVPSASRGMRVASPSKGSSTVSSSPEQDLFSVYAGAKFSDPPSPKVLPKPPMHWVVASGKDKPTAFTACSEMTNILKVMLNVQA